MGVEKDKPDSSVQQGGPGGGENQVPVEGEAVPEQGHRDRDFMSSMTETTKKMNNLRRQQRAMLEADKKSLEDLWEHVQVVPKNSRGLLKATLGDQQQLSAMTVVQVLV